MSEEFVVPAATQTVVAQNAITVMVVPGRAVPVLLDDGATVADALNAAGVDATGMQVRLGGEAASLEAAVEHGDRVILTRQIKGN